jgi:hypothetical protein
MRFIHLSFWAFCACFSPISAQSVLMGAANSGNVAIEAAPQSPQTPGNVNASDGIYDKFVLIRWEVSDQSGNFRVFRAKSASGASMLELTKTWQKSTWFCDYSAEKGQDYFYAVIGFDGRNSSPLSRFDKGFIKKDDKVVQEDLLSSTTPDRYAAGKQIFMLVAECRTDSAAYSAGSTATLRVGLQNVFEESAPRTDLRVYLSSDATWDFDDRLLATKSYSGFPASRKIALEERVLIPGDILPGGHYLIVVAAPEGNILNAKTGVTEIKVLEK